MFSFFLAVEHSGIETIRYFEKFGPWLDQSVLPAYKHLMMIEEHEEAAKSSGDISDPMKELIIKVLEKGTVEPKKVGVT